MKHIIWNRTNSKTYYQNQPYINRVQTKNKLFAFTAALMFIGSVANAQPIVTTVNGVDPIDKVECKNVTTDTKVKSSSVVGYSWNCTDLGLVSTPGDDITLKLTGFATTLSDFSGSVVGITNISKIKCKNNTLSQSVTITPATSVWNCTAAGLVINAGDEIKLQIDGVVEQVDHSTETLACVACHDGTTATGQSATHIPTKDSCDTCHATVAWNIITFDHSLIQTGCASCHYGSPLTGKSSTHISTTDNCEACHNITSWSPVLVVDHYEVLGSCASCHDGAVVAGKPTFHPSTTNLCEACHSTRAWFLWQVDHSHALGACQSCHNGTVAAGKIATHMATTDNCEACHIATVWAAAWVNHFEVLGTCESCHNGVIATGKPGNHIATADPCDTCHTTNSWF